MPGLSGCHIPTWAGSQTEGWPEVCKCLERCAHHQQTQKMLTLQGLGFIFFLNNISVIIVNIQGLGWLFFFFFAYNCKISRLGICYLGSVWRVSVFPLNSWLSFLLLNVKQYARWESVSSVVWEGEASFLMVRVSTAFWWKRASFLLWANWCSSSQVDENLAFRNCLASVSCFGYFLFSDHLSLLVSQTLPASWEHSVTELLVQIPLSQLMQY